jgi:hypothetical protein
MMLKSCKALSFGILTTFAYVGIFVYWQEYTRLSRMQYKLEESQNSTSTSSTTTTTTTSSNATATTKQFVRRRSHQIPKSDADLSKDDASINNFSSNDNSNITWNDKTIYDSIFKAMNKYFRKSKEEIDIVHGLGIGAVLEMVDPMGGRNFGCLSKYFFNWTFTNTTTTEQGSMPRFPVFESFFEWLDFGPGRDLELFDEDSRNKSCPKSHFDMGRHRKFTETERARFEIGFNVDKTKNGGRIFNVSFVASNFPVYNGEWLFVWGVDRKIYALDEKWGDNPHAAERIHYGHATFFCGRPVLFAGSMSVVNRTIEWISMASGHYKPTLPFMRNFYEFLRDEKGVNVTTIEWREHDNETLASNWAETLGENPKYGRYGHDFFSDA